MNRSLRRWAGETSYFSSSLDHSEWEWLSHFMLFIILFLFLLFFLECIISNPCSVPPPYEPADKAVVKYTCKRMISDVHVQGAVHASPSPSLSDLWTDVRRRSASAPSHANTFGWEGVVRKKGEKKSSRNDTAVRLAFHSRSVDERECANWRDGGIIISRALVVIDRFERENPNPNIFMICVKAIANFDKIRLKFRKKKKTRFLIAFFRRRQPVSALRFEPAISVVEKSTHQV